MKIENNSTIVFTGDSITDCDRNLPVGEGEGLGFGYVAMINALLGANYPELHIRVLNTGVSGNRITNLKTRWTEDVIDLKPDWLSIMIGINDVWRQFDNPEDPSQVEIDKFADVYKELLEKTLPLVEGIILATPFFIENNRNDGMRKMMDLYGATVKKLAEEYNTELADTQSGFDEYLKYNPTQLLCRDRVHPNLTGHMIIAKQFLSALDFEYKTPEWP